MLKRKGSIWLKEVPLGLLGVVVIALGLLGMHEMLFSSTNKVLLWDYTLILFAFSIVDYPLLVFILRKKNVTFLNILLVSLLSLIVPPAQLGYDTLLNNVSMPIVALAGMFLFSLILLPFGYTFYTRIMKSKKSFG